MKFYPLCVKLILKFDINKNVFFKNLIENRGRYYCRWKRYKTSDLHNLFKAARSDVTRSIHMAKSNYYGRKFEGVLNIESKWREIRNIGIGRNKENPNTDVDVNELNNKFDGGTSTITGDNEYINGLNNNVISTGN